MLGPYDHPKYLLKRAFFAVAPTIRVFDQGGNLCFFAKAKVFRLREDIRVFSDESATQELFAIKARNIVDFSAAYDVIDSTTNERVGVLTRKGWTSIVRDTWKVRNSADIEVGEITEDNMTLALVRRFLSNLVPQGYDMTLGGVKVADFQQRFNPFVYHLDVDFTLDPQGSLDRRIGIAAVVLLAIVEGRQRSG